MQPVEYYAYITQNIVLPEDIQEIYVINGPAVMGYNLHNCKIPCVPMASDIIIALKKRLLHTCHMHNVT